LNIPDPGAAARKIEHARTIVREPESVSFVAAKQLVKETIVGTEGTEHQANGGTALLIIDMINDLEFASGERLLPAARNAADAILRLGRKARTTDVPVVYVNDNYGRWHSERSSIVDHCSRADARGSEIVKLIQPEAEDYFVVKPQFSGFYSTSLPALLPRLGVNRLILTGVATDICVLFTAADAHMRQYDLWVPEDCVASADPQRTIWALEIMKNSMKADTRATSDFDLNDWIANSAADGQAE
jgi:nicotinamidase-related amidase